MASEDATGCEHCKDYVGKCPYCLSERPELVQTTTPTHCPVCKLDLRGSTWCSLQKPGCPMPATPPSRADAECERILRMSDAEIAAEAAAEGVDVEAEAARLRAMFEREVARHVRH
jgi:hypothetical protein